MRSRLAFTGTLLAYLSVLVGSVHAQTTATATSTILNPRQGGFQTVVTLAGKPFDCNAGRRTARPASPRRISTWT